MSDLFLALIQSSTAPQILIHPLGQSFILHIAMAEVLEKFKGITVKAGPREGSTLGELEHEYLVKAASRCPPDPTLKAYAKAKVALAELNTINQAPEAEHPAPSSQGAGARKIKRATSTSASTASQWFPDFRALLKKCNKTILFIAALIMVLFLTSTEMATISGRLTAFFIQKFIDFGMISVSTFLNSMLTSLQHPESSHEHVAAQVAKAVAEAVDSGDRKVEINMAYGGNSQISHQVFHTFVGAMIAWVGAHLRRQPQ